MGLSHLLFVLRPKAQQGNDKKQPVNDVRAGERDNRPMSVSGAFATHHLWV